LKYKHSRTYCNTIGTHVQYVRATRVRTYNVMSQLYTMYQLVLEYVRTYVHVYNYIISKTINTLSQKQLEIQAPA
jgi:hypothetical protein